MVETGIVLKLQSNYLFNLAKPERDFYRSEKASSSSLTLNQQWPMYFALSVCLFFSAIVFLLEKSGLRTRKKTTFKNSLLNIKSA